MFKIAEATLHDVPTIIKIAEQTWWPAYSAILNADQIRYMLDAIYAPDLLTSQITNGSQTYLLLAAMGKIHAFASFGSRQEDPSIYKIHKLYVLPDKQKKGYGEALIRDVIRRARENDVHFLDLNVNRYNPARSFYERLGFRIIREEDVPVGPYWMNDFVMRLELDSKSRTP